MRPKIRTQKIAALEKAPDAFATLFRKYVRWPNQFAPTRKRLYTPEVTFWLFLGQVLGTGASCQEVVARLLARLAPLGQKASTNTAAYCRARQRLDQKALDGVFEDLSAKAGALAPREQGWCGRKVKLCDGSSASMADTQNNQASYPQPTSQKPGCGFPVMRLVVLFSLSAGTVIAYAKDALRVSERELFHRLWPNLEEGDIVLADRGFCSYADFWLLLQRGVDAVMRKHQRRGKSSVEEKQLGKNDRLMRWKMTGSKPGWLDDAAWETMPDTMLVREITVDIETPGFRTKRIVIATTLLDPKQFPAHAFAELYRRRWAAELDLRDLKTTMGMDVLRCKSASMVNKELTMHLIAYNLLRIAMLEAAKQTASAPHTIGFKACLATVRQWAPQFAPLKDRPQKYATLYRALLNTIAANQTPQRPGRVEPRARKRRPKNYPLLTKPRKQFKEIPHRNRYHAPQS